MENVIRGAFFGAAVGDALGGPAELMSAEQIKEKYGVLKEMTGGGWLELAPGECTDDTHMILDVARGILANHAYPIEEIGHNFLRWYQSKPRDIGKTTETTFKNYMKTGNWKQAAQMTAQTINKQDSNGGLMRTLPITFGYWNNPQNMAKWSANIAQMTHASPEGSTCCIFYNTLVRLAASGNGPKRTMVSEALNMTDSHCKMMDINPSKFFWFMIRNVQTDASPVAPGGTALETLGAAVQSFLRTDTYEDALVEVVNRGQDTDTAGSITGGLAGAYYGYDAIPKRWLQDLKNKEAIDSVAQGFISFWGQRGFSR